MSFVPYIYGVLLIKAINVFWVYYLWFFAFFLFASNGYNVGIRVAPWAVANGLVYSFLRVVRSYNMMILILNRRDAFFALAAQLTIMDPPNY